VEIVERPVGKSGVAGLVTFVTSPWEVYSVTVA